MILPQLYQLWWKPCLRRDEGSVWSHCYFIAPTTHDSLYCWTCKAELGL